MQEGIGGWDPMYEGHLPWFVKVFVLYLLLAAAVLVFRCLKLTWDLLALRRVERRSESGDHSSFQPLSGSCQARITSTKNLALLTFILSLLVAACDTSGILRGISTERVTATAFLAGALAEVFTMFAIGLTVCAALYACAFFFESMLHKLSRQFNR
ncbi:MAG TPA: hypothetical protein VMI10_22630 [Terriglobales bacterium]|nr:hypothetical protein [Terriglobales bacterium]